MRWCVPLVALSLLVLVPTDRARADVIPFLPRTAAAALPEVSEEPLPETDPGASVLYVIRAPRDLQPLAGAAPGEIIPWFSEPDAAPFADWSVPDATLPANPVVQAVAAVPVNSDEPPATPDAPRPVGGGSFTVGTGRLGGTPTEPGLGGYFPGWGAPGWGWNGGWGNQFGNQFGNGFGNQFGGGGGGTGTNSASFSNPAIGQNRSRRSTTQQTTTNPTDTGTSTASSNSVVSPSGVLAASGLTTLGLEPDTLSLVTSRDEGVLDSNGVYHAPRFGSLGSAGVHFPGQSPDVDAAAITPEPATVAVLGAMAIGGGLYARRRRTVTG